MSTNQATLTPLPYGTTKDKLQKMYGKQMQEREIRQAINTIITANRGLTGSPKVIKVRYIELKEFVAIYGLPEGYRKRDDEINF